MAEGYSYIRGKGEVFVPFVMLIALQAALSMVVVNVPVLATDLLRLPADLSGLYIVAPGGIGAFIAAVWIPKRLERDWRKKKSIEISLFAFGFIYTVLVFLVTRLHYPYNIFLAMISNASAGFAYVGVLIPLQTFLQEKTPNRLRGRIFGNFWFMAMLATVIPVILSGTISHLFGIHTVIILLGIGAIVWLVIIRKKGDTFIRNGYSLRKGNQN